MTPEEFAEAIGVCGESVTRWEKGRGRPSRRKAEQIAERFGVTAEWIYGHSAARDRCMDMAGKRLESLRESKGLSVTAFSRLFHTNRRAILHWENGYGTPEPEILEAVAAHFGVTPEWILEGTAAPEWHTQNKPPRGVRTAGKALAAGGR
jgi:transcriptional regulator with XRE-family HTH domain